MTGFGVDLGAMNRSIKGINDTVALLKEFAPDGGHLMAGTTSLGFLCPDEDECGDDVLADALEEFFDRWKWGVRHLVKEGAAMVEALTDTRSVYEEAEDKLKQGFQLLIGDPNSTADPTRKSWEDLLREPAAFSSPGRQASFKPAGDRP
ncbi:hypothetical protein [Lentzea sp. NPDC059081]|uniref:hypothetical protein n=1 Tax=Lentzea sp. NPDC059081 TaxID=3346719 RepID=UPI0036CF6B8F